MLRVFNSTARYVDQGGNKVCNTFLHVVVLDSIVVLHHITIFSARCNIYNTRLCYSVSVRPSVTEVHWRIIANLGFKFRSHFTAHCGRRAACGRIISRYASQW